MENEVRKDYLLNRYVIIAAERAKRPTDFVVKAAERYVDKDCSFCPGNERLTPPADLVYLPKDGNITKEKDSDGLRHKGWVVRCFANLYPALSPHTKEVTLQNSKLHVKREAYGFHEIVVESPNHTEHPNVARLRQLGLMFDACLDLLKEFYNNESIEYAQIFRNHRKEAGASLSHAHTQIIAMPMIPRIISDEIEGSNQYYEKEGECIYCRIIDDEGKGPHLIYEGKDFLIVAPWASVHPFEFWILPKRHEPDLLGVTDSEKIDFVKTLRISLGGLAKLLNDPPYNYGFHIAPKSNKENEFYHWHLEVYPKLSIWAGFELSTGIYINGTPPEMAAESLREPIKKEMDSLTI